MPTPKLVLGPSSWPGSSAVIQKGHADDEVDADQRKADVDIDDLIIEVDESEIESELTAPAKKY